MSKESNTYLQDILTQFGQRNLTEWRKIENEIKPPPHFIQTYEKADGKYVYIYSEGLMPNHFSEASAIVGNCKRNGSMFPDLNILTLYDDNSIDAEFMFIDTDVKLKVNYRFDTFYCPNHTISITHSYKPSWSEYYLFSVEKYHSGIKVSVQMSIPLAFCKF